MSHEVQEKYTFPKDTMFAVVIDQKDYHRYETQPDENGLVIDRIVEVRGFPYDWSKYDNKGNRL